MTPGFVTDKQKLGWFGTAWLLSLLLSSSAWALNFQHETLRHESEASDLSSTLGRSRGLHASAPRKVERRDGLRVNLRHSAKAHGPRRQPRPRAKLKKNRVAKVARVRHHRG